MAESAPEQLHSYGYYSKGKKKGRRRFRSPGTVLGIISIAPT